MSDTPAGWALDAADRAISELLPTMIEPPSAAEIADARQAIARMLDQKIIDPLLASVTKQLKALFYVADPSPGGLATGGLATAPPGPPPEGVVGYRPGGRPVYDGDWFDQQMAKLGPGVTVTINAGPMPDEVKP